MISSRKERVEGKRKEGRKEAGGEEGGRGGGGGRQEAGVGRPPGPRAPSWSQEAFALHPMLLPPARELERVALSLGISIYRHKEKNGSGPFPSALRGYD